MSPSIIDMVIQFFYHLLTRIVHIVHVPIHLRPCYFGEQSIKIGQRTALGNFHALNRAVCPKVDYSGARIVNIRRSANSPYIDLLTGASQNIPLTDYVFKGICRQNAFCQSSLIFPPSFHLNRIRCDDWHKGRLCW